MAKEYVDISDNIHCIHVFSRFAKKERVELTSMPLRWKELADFFDLTIYLDADLEERSQMHKWKTCNGYTLLQRIVWRE